MHENKFIEIKHLKKYFNTPKGILHAVDDINFEIDRGNSGISWGVRLWKINNR